MVGSKSYYHNTQKEDGVNVSSKLLPVICTLSTEMMWQFGFLDNLFKHIGFDGKLNIGYGKVQNLPRLKYTRAEGMEGFVDTLFKFAAPDEMLDEDMDPSLNADWNGLFGGQR